MDPGRRIVNGCKSQVFMHHVVNYHRIRGHAVMRGQWHPNLHLSLPGGPTITRQGCILWAVHSMERERSVLPTERCVWTIQSRVLKANIKLLRRIRSLLKTTPT